MTRTITTGAELDALPDERVLLEASGRYRYQRGTFEQCWVRAVPPWIAGTPNRVWEVLVYGSEIPHSLVHTEDLDLPVAVLVDPSAPSATRDEVARTWIEAAPESSPGAWERASERVRERSLPRADALLARFTITPKEDR